MFPNPLLGLQGAFQFIGNILSISQEKSVTMSFKWFGKKYAIGCILPPIPYDILNFRTVGAGCKHFLTQLSIHHSLNIYLYIHTQISTHLKYNRTGTSLVAQWLRICLPMQGTRVQALVQEDPTCRRATKPVSHSYWACVPQLLKLVCLEPMLHNKRSHPNEKPAHCNKEQPPLTATRESPCAATKTQHSQK